MTARGRGSTFRSCAKLLATGALGAGLLFPASGQAANVGVVGGPCFLDSDPIPVGGIGFTPGRPVSLAYAGRTDTAFADPTGSFFGTITGSPEPRVGESDYTLTATDTANPGNVATTTFKRTRLGVSVSPSRARPSARVLFRISGFTPGGASIYGHYAFRGRHVRTVRIGVAKPPCGTLTTRRRSLPARTRYGTWSVQFDTSRKYSRNTVPRIEGRLVIYRRLVSSAAATDRGPVAGGQPTGLRWLLSR